MSNYAIIYGLICCLIILNKHNYEDITPAFIVLYLTNMDNSKIAAFILKLFKFKHS